MRRTKAQDMDGHKTWTDQIQTPAKLIADSLTHLITQSHCASTQLIRHTTSKHSSHLHTRNNNKINCTPTQTTLFHSAAILFLFLILPLFLFLCFSLSLVLLFYSPLYSESDFAADRRFDSADISDTMFAFVSDCRLCSNGT